MNPELPPNPRAELEARVTAWLLGELSAEEAATVQEMIAKDAELGRLRDRLAKTLNLLRETVATPMGETPAQPAPLKLSPERREKLLAHFKTIAPEEFAQPQRPKVSLLFILAAAASVAILVSLFLPALAKAKFKGQRSPIIEDLASLDRRASALGIPPPAAVTKMTPAVPPQTLQAGEPDSSVAENLRERRLSDNKPGATPSASQIVLPQNREQEVAQADQQKTDGVVTVAGGDVQFDQNGNRKLPETPLTQRNTGSAANGAEGFGAQQRIIVAHPALVTANPGYYATKEHGFGGGGAGGFTFAGSSGLATKKVTNAGLLADGLDASATTFNFTAGKDKLAKAEVPEGKFPAAGMPAPISPMSPITPITASAPAQNAIEDMNTSATRGYGNADGSRAVALEDAPLARAALPVPVPQAEVLTRTNAFTTFSLNISDVAFRLAEASLQNGVMPDAASMRSEEFINAFDYRDPEPAPGAPIGFAWERAGNPLAQNRDLLRFSIKTAAQGREAARPLNLVLLLDKSGSMERADRVEIIANALRVLASQLQPQDTLSVVVFARTARLFVDGVPGSQAGDIAKKLRDLTPEGGTNLEEAMRLAYATALRHYLANGENRVVLLTDGAANLGNVDPDALKQNVETNRKQGIALDCFGVGWDGYNDDLLERLSRAGNGRYEFISTPEEAATEFAGKLAGALRVAAADVKVQVEFNPNRVTSYRQIGYAKDQLKKEDFRDNNVKAAQIGAAESGNALYTVEINPAGEGPLGTVHVRFCVPGTGDYHEHEWTVPYTGGAVALGKASPAMRLTATAAAFSEWLAGSPYAADVTPDRLLTCLRGVPQVYGADARPTKLEWMIRQAKSISGK